MISYSRDAVLQSQQRPSRISNLGGDFNATNSNTSRVHIPTETSTEAASTSALLDRSSTRDEDDTSINDHCLPPLPAPSPSISKSLRISLHDPPVSRSVVSTPSTPTRSNALLNTPTRTRTQSPSILNLSQQSMVKQRLAQMERMGSQAPSTSQPIRRSTNRSRQYTPSIVSTPTSSVTSAPDRYTLTSTFSKGTNISSEEDTILDAYTNADRDDISVASPISALSGRLSSVPSVRTPGTVSSPKRLPIELPTTDAISVGQHKPQEAADMFSPASQYSELERESSLASQPFSLPFAVFSRGIAGLPSTSFHASEILKPHSRTIEASNSDRFNAPLPSVPAAIREEPGPSVASQILERLPPVLANIPANPEAAALLNSISDSVARVEGQGGHQEEQLGAVRTQLEDVSSRLREQRALQAQNATTDKAEEDKKHRLITSKLDDLQAMLNENIPELGKKMDEILKRPVPTPEPNATVMRNISPSHEDSPPASLESPESTALGPMTAVDLGPLEAKLGDLLAVCQGLQDKERPITESKSNGIDDQGPIVENVSITDIRDAWTPVDVSLDRFKRF